MFVFAGLCILAACSSVPSSGPLSSELEKQSEEQLIDEFGYELIDINEVSMATILRYQPKGFHQQFSSDIWRPTSKVGVGDVLSVVVWEPSIDGLFAGGETGKRAELGPFQIEQSGKIPIPYVGQITAKGRTIAQIRWAIQSQLEGKAIDPQVVVTLKENASSAVSVIGDVRTGGQIPISLRGDRILDILARAGGSTTPAGETMVTFIRGKKRATLLLQEVYNNEGDNIYVRPDDQIILTHNPQTFTAFGAVQKVGEYPIKASDVSLVEALGRIGGLNDRRANSTALYVFRYESAKLLNELGRSDYQDVRKRVPVIYSLNMREGRSYFFGQSFTVRDKDIVYVANAYGTEFQKFIGIIASVTSPIVGTTVSIDGLAD
ncbi:MAG: polysaccharide biosynthesis/export family protein [Pseudomonadota bacterium]